MIRRRKNERQKNGWMERQMVEEREKEGRKQMKG